eukprot:1653328-Karenia_brevis.AAC.1
MDQYLNIRFKTESCMRMFHDPCEWATALPTLVLSVSHQNRAGGRTAASALRGRIQAHVHVVPALTVVVVV